MATYLGRFQILTDPAAAWVAANPVLLAGEFGVADPGGSAPVLKVGDGVRPWSTLPAIVGGGGGSPDYVVGTTTTLAPGSFATVTIDNGVDPPTISFGIPQGAVGPTNSLAIGTVTTGAPGSAAAATIFGTPPSQVLNLTIPTGATGATGLQGGDGATGDPGPTGPANELTIGTVTTGTPGEPAEASITGTPPDQVLNLTIPAGADGAGTTLVAATGTIGLAAVAGVATTAPRSDSTPALDQAIAPTWTGAHSFTQAVNVTGDHVGVANTDVYYELNETDAAADQKVWWWRAASNQMAWQTRTDAGALGQDIVRVTRSGVAMVTMYFGNATANPAYNFLGTGVASLGGSLVVGGAAGGSLGVGTINATAVYDDGVLLTNATSGNPSASVGLTAVNGSAITFMRSDAAPALSQSIVPTWSGAHTFTAATGVALANAAGSILRLSDTDAATGKKNLSLRFVDGDFSIVQESDALAVVATPFAIDSFGAWKTQGSEGAVGQVLASQGPGFPTVWRHSGGGSIDLQFRFNTATTAADPGTSDFALNSATYSAVTAIYYDVATVSGFDASTILGLLALGNRIYIQQTSDSSRAAVFQVTGPATNNAGWWTVPVSFIATIGAGTLFASNAVCTHVFILSTSNPGGANPTALVGLTAVNGSSANFIRSDGAPALSQSIAPTWTGIHNFGTAATMQTSATIGARGRANAFEFGHTNAAGFASALGANAGNGRPFLAFNAEAGTTSNTFRTRGIVGRILMSDAAGALLIGRAATASADDQALTTDLTVAADGSTTVAGVLNVAGQLNLSALITQLSHSGGPVLKLTDTDAATDAKNWRIRNNDGTFIVSTENDAGTEQGQALNFTRAAAVILAMNFGNATHNPTFNFLGTGVVTHGGVTRGPDGSAALPTYSFTNDGNSGVYSAGADVLGIATGGLASAYFSGGLLSIGDGIAASGDRIRLRTSAATGASNFHHYLNASSTILDCYAYDGTLTSVGIMRFRQSQVQVADGTFSLPALTWTTDPDSGFFRQAANVIGVALGGAERVRFSSGSIPLRIHAADTVGDCLLGYYEPDGTTQKGYVGYGGTADDNLHVWNGEAASLILGTNAAARLTIDSAGGVFLGAATGGSQGAGTLNATGLYVNGVAIGAGATGANPSASVGLTAVNGAAATFMRSDAAPALSQSIAPVWSGVHNFGTASTIQSTATIGARGRPNAFEWGHATAAGYACTLGYGSSSGTPHLAFFAESGTTANTFRTRGFPGRVLQPDTTGLLAIGRIATASADNQTLTIDLSIAANGGLFMAGATGGSQGAGTINATGLYVNGVAVVAGAVAANPTATVQLTAVNGSASTFMRSDASPPLAVGIAPSWTGQHTWSLSLRAPAGTNSVPAFTFTLDSDTGLYNHTTDGIAVACGGATTLQITKGLLYLAGAAAGVTNQSLLRFQDSAATVVGYVGDVTTSDNNISLIASVAAANIVLTAGAGGIISCTNATSAPSFTTTSSRAIKRETGAPPKAASILARLRPILYRLLAGDDREQLGLIAEEVREVCPQLSDGKTVAYDRLAILLLAAWQDERASLAAP